MNNKQRVEFFQILKNQVPHPKTELIYKNHFELLIAVILSAQATDIRVNLVTKQLFKTAGTPSAIIKMGKEKLILQIKSIGLYKTKATNIIKTCHLLVKKYNNVIPDSREELEQLPGVGRKTANVILNVAFGKPVIAVDTHIFRVSNRTGFAKGKDPLSVELALDRRVPELYKKNAHHWLILHGRYTCKARRPMCGLCKIEHLCRFQNKTTLTSDISHRIND